MRTKRAKKTEGKFVLNRCSYMNISSDSSEDQREASPTAMAYTCTINNKIMVIIKLDLAERLSAHTAAASAVMVLSVNVSDRLVK